MASESHHPLSVIAILCILGAGVQTLECQIGNHGYGHGRNQCQWVLTGTNPCECTRIVMGGLNANMSPLSFDHIGKIREFFDQDCGEKAVSEAPQDVTSDTSDISKVATISSESGQDGSGTGSPAVESTSGNAPSTGVSTKSATTSSKPTTDMTSTNPPSTLASITTDVTSTMAPSNRKTTMLQTSTVVKTTAKVCNEKLGMQDGDIPNGNIGASDHYSSRPPWAGRLNGASTWGSSQSGPQYIQADIGKRYPFICNHINPHSVL
ncbi:uncharacterized protein [Amphiura filiformis]|uniref:uncharacterized protein n=1 Tax=Amphiura filiformis TaxID=82378 RepID=UPI003B217BA3